MNTLPGKQTIDLVGFGGIGQRHTEVLADSHYCEFAAIVEVSNENFEKAFEKYAPLVVQVFDNLDNSLTERETDS
jgi:predicted dehydrogenase